MAASCELDSLAKYLCVSCAQIKSSSPNEVPEVRLKNGSALKGLATISKYLARQSQNTAVLGHSREEEAAVSQWLEYRQLQVDRCEESKDIQQTLQELDSYLSDKVYFVGRQPTLADIFVYYGLHRVMNQLTFHEKQKYMNVSRWFNHIQHLPGARQKNSEVHFSKTVLYQGSSH